MPLALLGLSLSLCVGSGPRVGAARLRPASMSVTVFIDGEAGTTGLQVRSRLSHRDDLTLLTLPSELRKDSAARAEAINKADAVILCLPDAAAIEAAALLSPDNERTVLIDASTAHRVNPQWAYGFPELSAEQRAKISKAKRIANPGCYATGFIALLHPLVHAGIVAKDARLVASAVSGYSGGGNPLINVYEGGEPHEPWGAYGFSLSHKHLPEMRCFSGLERPPIFLPAVGDFAQGMVVSVPLHYDRDLTPDAAASESVGAKIHATLSKHYADAHFVTVMPLGEKGMKEAGLLERDAFLRPDSLNNSNHLQARPNPQQVRAPGDTRSCSVPVRRCELLLISCASPLRCLCTTTMTRGLAWSPRDLTILAKAQVAPLSRISTLRSDSTRRRAWSELDIRLRLMCPGRDQAKSWRPLAERTRRAGPREMRDANAADNIMTRHVRPWPRARDYKNMV